MSLNVFKIYQNMATIDADKLFEITPNKYAVDSKTNKDNEKLAYINVKFNANYLDSGLVPKYVSCSDLDIDKEHPQDYHNIAERNYYGDTKKYQMVINNPEDTENPGDHEIFNLVLVFLWKALGLAAEKAAKATPEDQRSPIQGTVFDVVENNKFWTKFYEPVIPKTYTEKDPKTGVSSVKDYKNLRSTIGFDFTKWPVNFKSRAGQVKSRVLIKMSAEEAASLKPGETDYTPYSMDDKINTPVKVFKYPGGSFYGKICFPGQMLVNAGVLQIKPILGLVAVTPNPESAFKREGGLEDAYKIKDQDSMLNNLGASISRDTNKTNSSSVIEDDIDELSSLRN